MVLTHHLKRVLSNAPKNAILGRQLFSTTSNLRHKQNLDRELLHSRTNPTLSYASTFSEFPMATSTIRELLAQKATEKGNNLAYLFPYQGVKLTFSELKERVDSAAQNLLDLGFHKGDRIAFALPNSVELLILSLAASEIGAISTLMNPAYQKVEFEYMLKKTRAKGLVIYDSFKVLQHMKLMQHLCPELETCAPGELKSALFPDLKHVIVLNSPLVPEKQVYKGTWQFSDISEKKSHQQQRNLPYVDLDDPALMVFTSGTTGNPKGAVISHGNLINSSYQANNVVEKTDALLLPCNAVPFFHIYGYSTGIIVPLIAHTDSTNLIPFYFPDTMMSMKFIQVFKCNTFRGVPTQFVDLLNHPERKNFDLSSLKNGLIAGASGGTELTNRLFNELKLEDLIIGYGMTETSMCHAITTIACKRRGFKYAYESCGRTIPFAESKIVDPNTGEIQPHGVDGELCVRGPHIIKEYWEEPEKTKEAIDENRWLKTGDVMSMDEEGYLFFKSRSKDIIVRGGANLYPAEIESFLNTHPDIADTQVFGVPDDRVGEEVAAWIKLEPGKVLADTDIREFCKGNISHFKIPRYMKFVDSFPLNASMKILKTKMRESAATDFNLKSQ